MTEKAEKTKFEQKLEDLVAEKKKKYDQQQIDMANFDWGKLEEEMGKDRHTGTALQPETSYDKLLRKMKEEPFIPFGMGATTLILVGGVVSFGLKRTKLSQQLMRARVVAQGATLVAVVVASFSAIKARKNESSQN